jgi:SAM-dependent methyltransferase|tara:strand:- start:145 stop:828 length:684 start_codon:yes stop_codon:yes gene_type:complete
MQYLNQVLEYFDISEKYRSYQIELFNEYVGKNVLEVGAGRGKIIEILSNDKSKFFTLLELDNNFYDYLIKNLQSEKIIVKNKKTTQINDKFDTIIYLDVIEHIDKDEEELNNALRLLEKNSHLIIIVPAFQILFSEFDKNVGHYRRYHKKFFKDYAQKNSLEIKQLKYFDVLGFFIVFLSKFIGLTNSKRNKLGIKIWNFLIPLSKFLDKIIFHSLGKSIICVYKKK